MSDVTAAAFCPVLLLDLCIQPNGAEVIYAGASDSTATAADLRKISSDVKELTVNASVKRKRGVSKIFASLKIGGDDAKVKKAGGLVEVVKEMGKLEVVKLNIGDKALIDAKYAPLLHQLNLRAIDNVRLEVAISSPPKDAVPMATLCEALASRLPHIHSLELRCSKSDNSHERHEAIGALLPTLRQLDTLDIGNADPHTTLDMDEILEHAFLKSPISLSPTIEKRVRYECLPLRTLKLTNGHFPIFSCNVKRLRNLKHLSENSLASLMYERLSDSSLSMGDSFYTLLAEHDIWLESLDISHIGRGLFDYLQQPALVGILTHITLDCPVSHAPVAAGDALAVEFWKDVLPLHARTMRHLCVTPFHDGSWCYSPNSACSEALQKCERLESLGLCPCLPSKVYVSDFLSTLTKSKLAGTLKTIRMEGTWSAMDGTGSVIGNCRKALDRNEKATRLRPSVGQEQDEDEWVYIYQDVPGAQIFVGPDMLVGEHLQIGDTLREAGFV